MSALLPFIVVGIANGSVYAIAGLGLVLTYRTSGIFNFAHGAQAALGAYLMYELRDLHGWPWPAAALASVAVAGVLVGFLLERLAFTLADAPTSTRVVATIGVLVAVQGVLAAKYGAATIPFRPFLSEQIVHLPGVNVRVDQLVVTGLALVAASGLFLFFRRSRLGVAMQGVVDDPALLGLQGTSPAAVRRWAWIVGSCFASLSGILLAPTIGLDVLILTLLVVQAFGAAAIGAFNSLVGTYVGGLAVGIGAALATKYLAGYPALAGLPSTLPFLVLFVALLVTPRRYLIERGARVVRRAALPAPLPRPVLTAVAAVGTVALVAAPRLAAGKLPVLTTGLAFVIIFTSLGLLARTSGQVSLCHMAFAAVGAAGFARAAEAGAPWLAAVVLGGLLAVPVGAVVAIPAIRLSGVYLAVATFGFGILMERIFFPSWLMFGSGALTVRRPAVGRLGTDTGYYYVLLAVALACAGLAVLVRRSRLGRLLRGLADCPEALTAFGADTNVTRVFVFCISAFLAGVGGAVLGPVTGSAGAGSFTFGISLTLLAVLAIAGRRPVASAFVAALLYAVLPGSVAASWVAYVPVAFGLAAIAASAAPGRILAAWLVRSPRLEARRDRPVACARLEALGTGGAS